MLSCMVSLLGRDKGSTMNDHESREEPEATPWPKKDRRQSIDAWPPELDEETWPREDVEVADEE